MQMLPKR